MATIGENIKRLRTKQGLSQDDLARKAELKYSTLTKIEGDFVKKPVFKWSQRLLKCSAFLLRPYSNNYDNTT